MPASYNYIITGSGCAGLSLLMRLLQTPKLQHKKILVIAAQTKTQNDRTWCFWEKENGLFENIVHHRWQQLQFKSNMFSSTFSIAPYQYKMLRSIDFYNYVLQYAKAFSNVEFIYETVTAIKNETNKAVVLTATNEYHADYIFNSILFKNMEATGANYFLKQHFKGLLIETTFPCFDAAVATFMDFTVSQQAGTTFMYVLPTSPTTALVEYTLFTKNLLQPNEYDIALKNYISTQLNISNYKIMHEEFGVIPMTNFNFPSRQGNIINIGTAGGQTKPSSGYTFQFIQKKTEQIVQSLIKNKHPFVEENFNDKKFRLYDSVLLNVLQNKKMSGDKIFSRIFQKNKPQQVLKFLDNETNLVEDLKIMGSVPMKTFLPTALKEMGSGLVRNRT